jgi:hypothetical protein
MQSMFFYRELSLQSSSGVLSTSKSNFKRDRPIRSISTRKQTLHFLLWNFSTHPQTSLGRWNQGEWGGQGIWHAWERNVYRVLVGKPERKRPLGRRKRRWEEGIRMDLREIGWGSVQWIQLAQDRGWWRAVVNTMMNLRVLATWS